MGGCCVMMRELRVASLWQMEDSSTVRGRRRKRVGASDELAIVGHSTAKRRKNLPAVYDSPRVQNFYHSIGSMYGFISHDWRGLAAPHDFLYRSASLCCVSGP